MAAIEGVPISQNTIRNNSACSLLLHTTIYSSTLIGSRALSQLHPGCTGIIWLLTSSWSNLMRHLLPYLQDDQKAADYLRPLRWPAGVTCPRCASDAVEPRERCDNGLQRLSCGHRAVRLGQLFAMFTDWTSSIFEESKLRPLEWLLVMGLWQLKLNATDIAAAPGYPGADRAAVYKSTRWWHLRDIPSGPDTSTGAPSGSG